MAERFSLKQRLLRCRLHKEVVSFGNTRKSVFFLKEPNQRKQKSKHHNEMIFVLARFVSANILYSEELETDYFELGSSSLADCSHTRALDQ